MSTVLLLSSQVAYGHVGLSAGAPVLRRLGHRVTPLPTVMLSNHPGWPHVAGMRTPVETLRAMVDALADNGWLAAHDTLLTGYLPTPDHVALAADLVARLRAANPAARVVVDPVLGDLPKGLYIDAAAAEAIRDGLVPLADVLTPNAFELGWLSGLDPDSPKLASLHGAECLARALAPAAHVLVTSPPMGAGQTGVLSVRPEGSAIFRMPQLSGVPHGVGDVLAALVAGGCAPGAALGHLSALIAQSLHADHLRIAETADFWAAAPPHHPEP